jgi:cytochrome c oxidase subunit 1
MLTGAVAMLTADAILALSSSRHRKSCSLAASLLVLSIRQYTLWLCLQWELSLSATCLLAQTIFGYSAIVWSTIAIGVLGFATWAHHMFTTGLSPILQAFFVISTMTIAVPTGVKMFNWIFTMIGGSLKLDTPLLFAIGFLSMFVIGGISGVFQAVLPFDRQVHDTYWVVAHIHYVLFGGSVFGIFAGLYYWIPKMTGWRLGERPGKVQFWLQFFGFNLTFFPMHILGLLGMPRRYYDYSPDSGWTEYNFAATIGAFLIATAVLVFIVNFVRSAARREPAGDDPWEGNTLEWATTSPPPVHNFMRIPVVESLRPVRDARLRLKAGASQD